MGNDFGGKVIVHRKGVTSAKAGEVGLLPGRQGMKSYIVEGLSNPDSFTSCSHGAGRLMIWKIAVNNLNLEEEKHKLDEQGIIHAIRHKNGLEGVIWLQRHCASNGVPKRFSKNTCRTKSVSGDKRDIKFLFV
jgi:RNA-splicing ligase RtcB